MGAAARAVDRRHRNSNIRLETKEKDDQSHELILA